MAKLPLISAVDLIKILAKIGFKPISQTLLLSLVYLETGQRFIVRKMQLHKNLLLISDSKIQNYHWNCKQARNK